MHERNGLGTRVREALLSEGDIRVEAGIARTGYIGGGLGLEIDECEVGYMDKRKGRKDTVLALVQEP